jgi:pyrroloquinoline quinone biosynthesis protein E
MRLRELILKIPKKYLHFKIFNLIKYIVFKKFHIIANKFKYFNLPYLPLTMDVEPTTGCNFRCTMCDVSSPNWITKNMKMETFKKLIDMNKQLLQIKLQGMGEPFVNKNYLEFVDYASNYGIFIQFVTNGSLLDEKLINSLCERKNISLIGVSIDGATKKTFEKIRIRSNFELIISNTRRLISKIQEKDKKTRPQIRALSLIQSENFHETEQIMYLCKNLGFDELFYQVQLTGWGKKDWEINNSKKDINYDKKNNSQLFKEIIKKGKEINFKVEVNEVDLLSKERPCSYPWNTPYVNTDGLLSPCTMIPDPKVFTFGSIHETDFKKIWNSNKYKSFRKDIATHNLRDYCKNCYKSRS